MRLRLIFITGYHFCLFSMLSAQKAETPLLAQFLSATDSAVILIQSDYILRDTSGEDYVRENNYYSRIFSLGVAANKTLYLTPSAYFPWKSDVTLKKLDLAGDKRPILSQIEIRSFPFVQKEEVEFFQIDTVHNIVQDKSPLPQQRQLTIDNKIGAQNVWIILYSKESPKSNELRKQFFEKNLTFSNETQEQTLEGILAPSGFIGGLILLPIIKTGSIDIQVSGLVYTNFNKKPGALFWYHLQGSSTLRKLEKSPTKTAPTAEEIKPSNTPMQPKNEVKAQNKNQKSEKKDNQKKEPSKQQ